MAVLGVAPRADSLILALRRSTDRSIVRTNSSYGVGCRPLRQKYLATANLLGLGNPQGFSLRAKLGDPYCLVRSSDDVETLSKSLPFPHPLHLEVGMLRTM